MPNKAKRKAKKPSSYDPLFNATVTNRDIDVVTWIFNKIGENPEYYNWFNTNFIVVDNHLYFKIM